MILIICRLTLRMMTDGTERKLFQSSCIDAKCHQNYPVQLKLVTGSIPKGCSMRAPGSFPSSHRPRGVSLQGGATPTRGTRASGSSALFSGDTSSRLRVGATQCPVPYLLLWCFPFLPLTSGMAMRERGDDDDRSAMATRIHDD